MWSKVSIVPKGVAPSFLDGDDPEASGSASADEACVFRRRGGAEVQVVAAVGQVAFELAEGLVLLVADAGHGQVQRLADLGDGPASGPELDDPVLPGGEDGAAGGFEDLAEFLTLAMRGRRGRGRG